LPAGSLEAEVSASRLTAGIALYRNL